MTKTDAKNAADMIEMYFFQNLCDNDSIDNIDYLRSMLRALDALRDPQEAPVQYVPYPSMEGPYAHFDPPVIYCDDKQTHQHTSPNRTTEVTCQDEGIW